MAADKYSQVKKTLFPDAAVSSESDSGGTSRFHLLVVPPSVDRSALKVALRALKWPVRVSRSSGYKAWVVFSAVAPPTRSFPLAGDTVVVIESSNNTRGPVPSLPPLARTLRRSSSRFLFRPKRFLSKSLLKLVPSMTNWPSKLAKRFWTWKRKCSRLLQKLMISKLPMIPVLLRLSTKSKRLVNKFRPNPKILMRSLNACLTSFFAINSPVWKRWRKPVSLQSLPFALSISKAILNSKRCCRSPLLRHVRW